jgi:hypothetical protein
MYSWEADLVEIAKPHSLKNDYRVRPMEEGPEVWCVSCNRCVADVGTSFTDMLEEVKRHDELNHVRKPNEQR